MWWVIGGATVVAFFASSYLLYERVHNAVAFCLTWSITILVFVGLEYALIPGEPATPRAQVANEQCSDRVDELRPDSTSIVRYEGCPGYATCIKKARLDGRKANCAEWRKWPEEGEQQAIFDRYFETYYDEIVRKQQEQSRRQEMCDQIGCDYYPEPEEPPCTGFYYC